ncbi:unnamed protein product [Enterobius vermicularis]|uniref:Isochorismatase domain-containing protein 1 n=1 Tax=Enterobius vermicularis TaxID=51028 RepID=A0A0N4UUG5_ENTVE|nr:unnamed protein product [Enterobius vermicularis]
MGSTERRAIHRLTSQKTVLLLCDIQEAFRAPVAHFAEIVEVSKQLLSAFIVLGMKVIATEQYPKGLGRTVQELEIEKHPVTVFEKKKFSMCIPPVIAEIGDHYDSAVLCGVESHVCVLHTAFDLLERGIHVYVVANAVSSRSKTDRFFALRQLEKAGAVVTTSECVILGLIGGADHPKFKEIQAIIKTPAPDTGLYPAFSCQ